MKLKTAIEYWDFIKTVGLRGYWYRYDDYIQLLKQPLQLGFFIPCDKEGKPLDKPMIYDHYLKYGQYGNLNGTELKACKEYQQACDRVLFKGFEIVEHSKGYFYIENDIHVVAQKNYGCDWVFVGYKTINDLSGKVDLVEKVAEKYKY